MIKSIPLMLQEVLEGSVFSVLIITLITGLGKEGISAYSIAMKIVAFCLLPMYMYCNSLTVLVGEYQVKKQIQKLKILPYITMGLTLCIYAVMAAIVYMNKGNAVKILTNIPDVQDKTLEILKTVLFFSGFQIFFENGKYLLQSIGKSKQVLRTTVVINLTASVWLMILQYSRLLDLKMILLTLSLNYLLLFSFFFMGYVKEIKSLFAFQMRDENANIEIWWDIVLNRNNKEKP